MVERIGWTGTRSLSTAGQQFIDGVLDAVPTDCVIVTGGCVGADAYVARAAKQRGLYVHTILPANRSQVDPDWAAYCDSFTLMPEGSSYRDRNEEIVRQSDQMYGVADYPERHGQSRRSGTWMTVRIARRAAVPIETYIQH